MVSPTRQSTVTTQLMQRKVQVNGCWLVTSEEFSLDDRANRGTGLLPPPVNGCGGRRATAEMRRENSAVYVALIADDNGNDVAEVQL